MRVYRESKQPNKLFFTNYKRLDEFEVFTDIKDILVNSGFMEFGEKIMGPSEDVYICKMENNEFSLIYDIDYGGSIYCENKSILDKLEKLLNEN